MKIIKRLIFLLGSIIGGVGLAALIELVQTFAINGR